MIELTVPYPPKELNPNAKTHWAKKAHWVKLYRGLCRDIALLNTEPVPSGDLVYDMTFYPPDRRRRDDDNMVASGKSGRDGIAEALGIDDVRFQLRVRVREPFPGGKVTIKIYEDLEE